MADEEWEENPFENRPAEKRKVVEKDTSKPARPVPPPPDMEEDNPFERGSTTAPEDLNRDDRSPFENRPGIGYSGSDLDDDYVDMDEFDKSKLATVSGMGFVGLAAFFVLFVIMPGN
ncbi:MAG: hypothetical protein V3U51_01505, partial [Thermoplasmata archaeon]